MTDHANSLTKGQLLINDSTNQCSIHTLWMNIWCLKLVFNIFITHQWMEHFCVQSWEKIVSLVHPLGPTENNKGFGDGEKTVSLF